MFKEKLGICLYEENCYEEEIIKIQDDIEETYKEPIEVIDRVSNDESNKESNQELNKKSNKESNKELIETISLKNDENTTNWYDKNKFNKILTTIDSNNFNHKNKKGKLKFYDINNLINNIKNNTISGANTKKKINALNEIKKVETNGKRLIDGQKIMLNLFVDLKTLFNNNNNSNNNESDSENENESINKDENQNENENESENES